LGAVGRSCRQDDKRRSNHDEALVHGILLSFEESNRTSFAFPDAGLSARAWQNHDPKRCHAQGLINACLRILRCASTHPSMPLLHNLKHNKVLHCHDGGAVVERIIGHLRSAPELENERWARSAKRGRVRSEFPDRFPGRDAGARLRRGQDGGQVHHATGGAGTVVCSSRQPRAARKGLSSLKRFIFLASFCQKS
jgi:hypothetical protein